MTASTKPDKSAPPALQEAERFQFRIRDLLLLMLTVALGAAALAQQSPPLFFAFVAVGLWCVYLWRRVWLAFPVITGLGVLAILGVLVALLLPLVQAAGSRPRPPCSNNLKQIVIALHNYQDTLGTFPPAYIADENGRPMHSWRVLILPFLEQQDLYSQYRFDEPWDGPNNRKLADQLKRVYFCPADHPKGSTETSYVAVIGPHTAWPGETALSYSRDFPDGTSNVLMVVEVHDSGIHWMEPRDLHVTQMTPTINAPHGQGIRSDHRHGANSAFADGHVYYLDESLPADVLRSWINRDDGTLPEPPKP